MLRLLIQNQMLIQNQSQRECSELNPVLSNVLRFH